MEDYKKAEESTFYSMWGDYYEILAKLKTSIIKAILDNDLDTVYILVQSEYFHVMPYMIETDAQECKIIEKKLDLLESGLSKKNIPVRFMFKIIGEIRKSLYLFEAKNNMLQPKYLKEDPRLKRRRFG